MRLTPAQIAVKLICGHNLPMKPQHTLKQCLVEGRKQLREITGVDFEYDLQRWHDHLKESRQGGYTWSRAIVFPKIMAEALASPDQLERYKKITRDVSDTTGHAKIAAADAQAVVSHIKRGRGTVGALVMDEAVYDDLQEMLRDLKHNPWKFLWRE